MPLWANPSYPLVQWLSSHRPAIKNPALEWVGLSAADRAMGGLDEFGQALSINDFDAVAVNHN